MRWLWGGILAIAAVTPVGAQQPVAQPQVEVTLNEAIERSLQVQPAVIQARGDQRNAGASKRSAYGAFIPAVTVGASQSHRNNAGVDPQTGRPVPPTSYSGNFTASLDLFDGFRRFANVKAASASGTAAEAGVVNQRFQTTLETKQVFYNAIATEALVRVADAQVTRARQQLQISVDKLHAGSATRSDSLRSTVGTAMRASLFGLRGIRASAQAGLRVRSGWTARRARRPIRPSGSPDTAVAPHDRCGIPCSRAGGGAGEPRARAGVGRAGQLG
jgi:outer membrane protein TolC